MTVSSPPRRAERIDMNKPSIGCVVPTLNSAETLDMTLLSLRSQKDVELQVIVADSGSTDGTLDICRRWNIPVIQVAPGNMYYAINQGFRKYDSEWVTYLNSDDWIYPNTYHRLLTQSIPMKADVIYGNCDYSDSQGRFVYSFSAAEPNELLPLFRLRRMGFAQQTAVFRRRLFQELNGFDETFRFRADADFFIRALLAGKYFTKLPGPPVACFRLHSKQFSNQGLEQTEIEADRIFGQEQLVSHFRDWLTLGSWRVRNLPQYAIRIIRESLLSRRARLPRAIEHYRHD